MSHNKIPGNCSLSPLWSLKKKATPQRKPHVCFLLLLLLLWSCMILCLQLKVLFRPRILFFFSFGNWGGGHWGHWAKSNEKAPPIPTSSNEYPKGWQLCKHIKAKPKRAGNGLTALMKFKPLFGQWIGEISDFSEILSQKRPLKLSFKDKIAYGYWGIYIMHPLGHAWHEVTWFWQGFSTAIRVDILCSLDDQVTEIHFDFSHKKLEKKYHSKVINIVPS